MKAIILAAGEGARLKKYTQDLPKGMLQFDGKSLISRQVETLRNQEITDISIIKGYAQNKINIPNTKSYYNKDYAVTNMVSTLFCADQELEGELIVAYSDIIYDRSVLEKVVKSNADIGVVVDVDYLDYWKNRLKNWMDDLETLSIGESGNIVNLGEPTKDLEEAKVRYVGLIKFSRQGLEGFKKAFHAAKEKHWDSSKPWRNSKSFKQAYMTDMLQEVIDLGIKVEPIEINRGWLEFDTNEDYERAKTWVEQGNIDRYINLGVEQ